MKVKIKKMSDHAVIPKYAKHGDSGFDLVATEDVIIKPGETKKIPVGLAFEIPEGHELQIRPRSGITSNTKVRVQFGTVDSGYRGEVNVTVDNFGRKDIKPVYYTLGVNGERYETFEAVHLYTYIIKKGDRIAQGVIAPVIQATFLETDELSNSERGISGFGSTGVSV